MSNGLDECAMSISSNRNHGSEIAMKAISLEEYTRLVGDSVQLNEAKKTVVKLTKCTEKRDATILKLEKKLEFGNISTVSLQYF